MTPAQKGAAFLDNAKPGWYREIDIQRLDLSIGPNCVIGQLYGGEWGSFSKGILHLDIVGQTSDLGFSAQDDWFIHEPQLEAQLEAQWEALTDEWRELVNARLAAEN